MSFQSRFSKCSANVFSDTKHKHVCWKICKVSKAFKCVTGLYFFTVLNELKFVKWVRFLKRGCLLGQPWWPTISLSLFHTIKKASQSPGIVHVLITFMIYHKLSILFLINIGFVPQNFAFVSCMCVKILTFQVLPLIFIFIFNV